MKNLGDMMKQVQQMQQRMAEAQARLEEQTVTGVAGAGMVSVTLNGKGVMTGIEIDDTMIKPEEKEIIEDLIIAAHADARAKVEKMMADQMKEVTGGLPLPPGYQMPV